MALTPESFPRVLVLGDVMLETFLLPTSDAKTKPPARYNRSDEYGPAEASRIPSGALELRQMIENLYEVEIANETKPPQKIVPLKDEYAKRILTYDYSTSWPWDGMDLHTYGHQLGVFPQSDRTR